MHQKVKLTDQTNFCGVGPIPRPQPQLAPTVLELFSLKGKVAAISGASAGIGLAVAEAYAQAGADVAMWYNSTNCEAKANEFSTRYGVRVKTYKVVVSDADQVENAVAQVKTDFGRLDVFVANAGIAWTHGPLIEAQGHHQWRKIMDVDLDGAYYCAKAVGRIFKDQGSGSLIFTASVSATLVNVPQRQAAYNAAKAAVVHLSKSLAVEWAGFARVNSISPGFIATEMVDGNDPKMVDLWLKQIPAGRMASARELTGTYLYLASDASTYTTGADIIVDGGYTLP